MICSNHCDGGNICDTGGCGEKHLNGSKCMSPSQRRRILTKPYHPYLYEIFCEPGIGKCKKKRNPHFILILSSSWNLIKFAPDFALDFYPHFILILKLH